MPSPFATEKAGRNACEVRSLDDRGDARNGDGFARYTIEYISDDQAVVVAPMIFRDKETALASARALLSAGFLVTRVGGPEFEMDYVALAALYKSQRST
ncbi:MAG TPA: hypothetical protein VGU20_02645 [Stellaceae bacterium]|nr:hypothetical protein [Stellaceae bacterium]